MGRKKDGTPRAHKKGGVPCLPPEEVGMTAPPPEPQYIHAHGNRVHAHAHASVPHGHIMRAVCQRPECDGFETHDIHPEAKK